MQGQMDMSFRISWVNIALKEESLLEQKIMNSMLLLDLGEKVKPGDE